MSDILKRKEIPIVITAFVGIVVILSYFVTFDPLQSTANTITSWGAIIVASMLFIGLINLCQVHLNRIMKREKGVWPFSAWLLVAMFGTIIIGLWAGVPWGGTNDSWVFIYTYINTSISQTIFSLFGFYVISATIHALKARNLESGIFLISSFIIFFWAMPVGTYIWAGFSPLGDWVMNVLTAGAYRGILLGISLGLISFGIRVIAGIERGYLRRGD